MACLAWSSPSQRLSRSPQGPRLSAPRDASPANLRIEGVARLGLMENHQAFDSELLVEPRARAISPKSLRNLSASSRRMVVFRNPSNQRSRNFLSRGATCIFDAQAPKSLRFLSDLYPAIALMWCMKQNWHRLNEIIELDAGHWATRVRAALARGGRRGWVSMGIRFGITKRGFRPSRCVRAGPSAQGVSSGRLAPLLRHEVAIQ